MTRPGARAQRTREQPASAAATRARSGCRVTAITGASVRFDRMTADAVELRVLGCLIEKQRTTPEVYPLSLNALRAACNQTTSRDPIVQYDEAMIRGALERLSRRGWTRLASGPGSRTAKYRHLLKEALGLGDAELAVLCLLLVRGPQTVGELKQRSERMQRFESLEAVESTLEALIERQLAVRLERRPGQKEQRYAQRLGGGEHLDGAAPVVTPRVADGDATLEARVARLEEQVDALRRALRPEQP